MKERVRKYIEEKQLIGDNKQLIVGVSGGADSVALLDILHHLGYRCIAAHCNFHLRGQESNRDTLFVQEMCNTYKIPCHTIDFETLAYSNHKSISIEMAARELRYSWFEELRLVTNSDCIAVGHHQDDSVETVLLNLIRGTGIRGLTGISAKKGRIIRPLLCLTKADILSYLTEKNIAFVNDNTNAEDIYTRNKIRLSIIPLLQSINPSVKGAISRTSEHLLQVENIYKTYIEEASLHVLKEDKIDIQQLMKYVEPKAILFEILSVYNFNSTTVYSLFEGLEGLSGKIYYSETHRLIKDRNSIIIKELESQLGDELFEINKTDTSISKPISLSIDSLTNDDQLEMDKNPNILYLDWNKLHFPLTMRKWKQGDWFIPLGMRGKKKISDYFSDNKFSIFDKENTWLLCSGHSIIWVVGYRSDDRYKITDATDKILKIRILA